MNRDQFPDAPSRRRTGVGRRLDGADIAAHENGDIPSPDVFLADQHDIGSLDHRVSGLDGTDEAHGLYQSERISCHERTLTELRSIIPLSMRRTLASFVAVIALTTGCAGGEEGGTPVATPSVSLSAPVAAIGSPLEMSYRFAIAPDAPTLSDDYWVFVHFFDTDGELLWTDDHKPPTPVGQWKPGSIVEYQRTMFVPKFPYVGETRVEVGLFSMTSGERLPLVGETRGQRSYQVATFEMALQSDSLFVVFRGGWHGAEAAGSGLGVEWQWSQKEGVLTFANPMRDVRVYLSVDQPAAAFPEPQRVEIRIGSTVVDSFTLSAGQSELRRIPVQASQLGTAEMVEMTVTVDKTFVPASVSALGSTDTRELGIRVFRAFVQPL